MPQMFKYCGQRFRVYKSAHKTCDTVNPVAGRRVANSVHLELRCDGLAYGDCPAGCLIFWKEAWLKPLNKTAELISSLPDGEQTKTCGAGCTEEGVRRATYIRGQSDEDIRYVCQATQLPYFTSPLSPWDIRQYVEDYVSGNVSLGQMLRGLTYISYYHLTFAKRWGRSGRPARWIYDQFQALIKGVPYPQKRGTIPAGQPTPMVDLNLQPGELVRVKSHEEILATLDGLKNRGMFFDAELVPYCNRVYRVQKRVTNFVNEQTGKISRLKTPAVILENVWCRSRYSNCRMFCPRSIYPWWREIWLERVPEGHTELNFSDANVLRDERGSARRGNRQPH